MRNYIKIHRCTLENSGFVMQIMGIDEESMQLLSDAERAAWDATNPPPNPPYVWTQTPTFTNYIELDRENIGAAMTFLLREVSSVAGVTLPSLLSGTFYADFAENWVAESPKKTWSNGK